MAEKGDFIYTVGSVAEILTNKMYRIDLEDKTKVIAHIHGTKSEKKKKLFLGDKVKVERSVYDISRGRIVEILK
jgi:translation initiation factor IF-1